MADSGAVLVCVSDRSDCLRLLKAGAEVAAREERPLEAVAVLPLSLVSRGTADTLEVYHNLAGRMGAQLQVYFGDEPALTMAVHACKASVSHLICAAPESGGTVFVETLRGLLPEVPMSLVYN